MEPPVDGRSHGDGHHVSLSGEPRLPDGGRVHQRHICTEVRAVSQQLAHHRRAVAGRARCRRVGRLAQQKGARPGCASPLDGLLGRDKLDAEGIAQLPGFAGEQLAHSFRCRITGFRGDRHGKAEVSRPGYCLGGSKRVRRRASASRRRLRIARGPAHQSGVSTKRAVPVKGSVTCLIPLPSAFITVICLPRMKTICLPLGDQAGATLSVPLVSVS